MENSLGKNVLHTQNEMSGMMTGPAALHTFVCKDYGHKALKTHEAFSRAYLEDVCQKCSLVDQQVRFDGVTLFCQE